MDELKQPYLTHDQTMERHHKFLELLDQQLKLYYDSKTFSRFKPTDVSKMHEEVFGKKDFNALNEFLKFLLNQMLASGIAFTEDPYKKYMREHGVQPDSADAG